MEICKQDEIRDCVGSKRKLKKTIPKGMLMEEFLSSWTQCNYYMKGKNRFCNVAKAPNSLFCGTHRPVAEGPSSKAARHNNSEPLERCPCPVDPTHSIYKHNLAHHVKICNITTRNTLLAQQPYYSENCNSGPSSEALPGASTGIVNPETLFLKIRQCYQSLFKTACFADNSFEFHVINEDSIERVVLNAVARDQTSEDKLRHCQQDTYLVKQMIAHKLLRATCTVEPGGSELKDSIDMDNTKGEAFQDTKDIAYVELGAGKGMLGLAVQSVTPKSTIVLVERSGMRRKADKIIRDTEGQSYRARMDIRHCFLPMLPGVCNSVNMPLSVLISSKLMSTCVMITQMEFNDNIDGNGTCGVVSTSTKTAAESTNVVGSPSIGTKRVVVIAKHLCGVATDLAIRSFEAFRVSPNVDIDFSHSMLSTEHTCTADIETKLSDRAKGLAIATCCHHACCWDDYVGQSWLRGLGFSRDEFDVLKLWSGWAHTLRTCAGRRKQPGDESSEATIDGIGEPTSHSAVEAAAEAATEQEEIIQHAVNAVDAEKFTSVIRPIGISYEEMSTIGIQTKRLLDQGRVEYLKASYGFIAHQLQFCSPVLSPECVAIIAHR